jgi:purine-binding chemotaxis protein CheW
MLAIEINSIREIIRVPELQKSVIPDENCIGMVNLRGSILPLLDFVKLLNFREGSPRVPADERIIVMQIGDSKVGLLIDRLDNIVSLYKDEILPIPLLNQSRTDMFSGLISRENSSDMILLNAEGVLSNPVIKTVVDGYIRSFGAANISNDLNDAKKKSSSQRRVCIAFQLDRGFTLPIQQIREIINYSEDTIKPPGLPTHIRGVLNLRGQAVTLVDLRALYGLTPFTDFSQVKVLIVERNQEKFGLLVDSVEDIISFFDEQRLDLPKSLLGGDQDTVQGDVKEILELAGTLNQPKKCLMILDLEKVLSRIEGVLKAA